MDFSPTFYVELTSPLHFSKFSNANFASFDFLDEHHILYAGTSEDSIYVYDLRCGCWTDQSTKAEAGHQRFELELPPIRRATTSRYIQVRRNALPMRMPQHELHVGDGDGARTSPPPFHADPRARLVVLRIITSPVKTGEEQFELHVPARALLEHFAVMRDAGGDAAVPWSAWRADTEVTPVRRLLYFPRARMIAYGMRAVSHPPHWDEGVLYVNSYPPRRAGAVRAGLGAGVGTRQGIPLPDELHEMTNFLSVLCEDGLLFFKVVSFPPSSFEPNTSREAN